MSTPVHTSYPRSGLRRGLTNNSTCTTFVVPVPTTTEPVSVDTTDALTTNLLVVPCAGSKMQLFPFGTNANNETLNLRVYLWRKIAKGTNASDLWVPKFMGGFVCTLSSALAGLSGSPLTTSEFFADTITEEATATWDDATAPYNVIVRSYANDQLAQIDIDTHGWEKLEVRFDIGTCDTGNVCYAIV